MSSGFDSLQGKISNTCTLKRKSDRYFVYKSERCLHQHFYIPIIVQLEFKSLKAWISEISSAPITNRKLTGKKIQKHPVLVSCLANVNIFCEKKCDSNRATEVDDYYDL